MTKIKVRIRTAIKLDRKSLDSLRKFIRKKHSGEPEFFITLDQSLLAGFKLNVEGIEYDYSLSGSLDRLQQEL